MKLSLMILLGLQSFEHANGFATENGSMLMAANGSRLEIM
jgi:hypothetical protein